MDIIFQHRGTTVFLLFLFTIGLVSCEGFILGSAEEGDPVVVNFKLATLQEEVYSSGTLSITNYLSINRIEMDLRDINVRNPQDASHKFILPDSGMTFTESVSELKISEKILPEGNYNLFLLRMGNKSNQKARALVSANRDLSRQDERNFERPENETTGDGEINIKDGMGFRTPGLSNENDGAGYNSSPKKTSGKSTSESEARQKVQETEKRFFSLKVQGTYRGEDFEFIMDQRIERIFEFNPVLSVGKRSDTVTTVKLLFDYSQWFKGTAENTYLDPTDEANQAQINQNIINSIYLNHYKGDEEEDEFEGNGEGNTRDNREIPVLSFDKPEISEGDSLARITVSMSQAINYEVQMDYETRDGTAKAGEDYRAASGTLRLDPGETGKMLEIPILDDNLEEEDRESFKVLFSNPVNARFEEETITLDISDNDGAPMISVDDASAPENEEKMSFTVSLTHPSVKKIQVKYATKDSTAKASGVDYSHTSGTLTFETGQVKKTVTVPLTDDAKKELSSKKFLFQLFNPQNAVLGRNSATGTIFDDESTPVVTVEAGTVAESDGPAVLKAKLSAPSELPVSFDYNTSGQTAKSGSDFTAKSGTVSLDPGIQTQSFSIPIKDDNIQESVEEFIIAFSNPENVILGTEKVAFTITDDDVASIRISDAQAGEGDGSLSFRVWLESSSDLPVEVNFKTENGSARTENGDYESKNGTLTFEPGRTERYIEVPVNDDSEVEETEEDFYVVLSNPTNSELGDKRGRGTITDNDEPEPVAPTPTISIADAAASEDAGTIKFDVSLSGASPKTVSVQYSTGGGETQTTKQFSADSEPAGLSPSQGRNQIDTGVFDEGSLSEQGRKFSDGNSIKAAEAGSGQLAVAGDDYEAASGTLTFSPGETRKSVSVRLIDDQNEEPDETFTINLTNPVNSELDPSASQATGTILNDDEKILPQIRISNASASEDEGNITFNVSLSSATGENVSVNYNTRDITAIAGEDYRSGFGTVTFLPGETRRTVSVEVLDDSKFEQDERFEIRLTNPVNGVLDNAAKRAEGTIINDDEQQLPVVGIADAEGKESDGQLRFTVTLSSALSKAVPVKYSTSDGSAEAGEDYTGNSGQVVFTPGQTQRIISIDVMDDSKHEQDESFTVQLTKAVNAELDPSASQATGTILDDDEKILPKVSIDAAEASESSGTIAFKVRLSEVATEEVRVDYETSDGSASAGEDYESFTGVLTIPAGNSQGTISIELLDDDEPEPDESFNVRLKNPVNAELDPSARQAAGTIFNDDEEEEEQEQPLAGISNSEAAENSGKIVFKVTLSDVYDEEVRIDYSTSDISAFSGEDYTADSGTLTFSPGDTERTVNVTILDDETYEQDETFEIRLSNPVNAELEKGSEVAKGVIINDDEEILPMLSVGDAEGSEGNGQLLFTVQLSGSSSNEIRVNYNTVDGSALAGEDYTGYSGQLTFSPGQTEHTVSIEILDDSIVEPDETFMLRLSNPANAELDDLAREGEGTIVDNDEKAPENITICHYTPGKGKKPGVTLTIPESAWPTHGTHGDTIGACSE